jgi:hypothetical protein
VVALAFVGWFSPREADYQRAWAAQHGGHIEHRLADGTRIDVLTGSHAVEVEYGCKWAEAIGQALWYATASGKTPGIVLISNGSARQNGQAARAARRILAVSEAYRLGIDVWRMDRSEIGNSKLETGEGSPKPAVSPCPVSSFKSPVSAAKREE